MSEGIHPAKLEATVAHKATITKKLGVRPIHIECSCNGTGGDFFDVDSAKQYMATHALRVKSTTGETVEIVDKTSDKPPVQPVKTVEVPIKPIAAPVPAPKAKDDSAT